MYISITEHCLNNFFNISLSLFDPIIQLMRYTCNVIHKMLRISYPMI